LGTTKFSRVDTVTCVYLQWIIRCNEYGGNIVIPNGLLLYLSRARKKSSSFQQAIGQYGEDAFVLTMIRKKNCDVGRVIIGLLVVMMTVGFIYVVMIIRN
jgi:hypothetical protein